MAFERSGLPGRREADRLRLRLFRLLAFRLALGFSAGALFAAGLAALLLRILVAAPARPLAALPAAAVLLPLLPAAVLAWRRTPSAAQCLAWLDAAGSTGGLLLISGLPGSDDWRSRIPPSLPVPRLAWREPRRPAAWLAAAAFAAAILLVPDRLVSAVLATPLDLTPLLAPLEQQAAALLEPDLPPAPGQETWREELENSAALHDGADPARALEALDHLREQIEQAGARTAETLMREQDQMRAAEAVAEALQGALGQGGPEADAAASLMAFNDFLAGQEWPASFTNGLPAGLQAALSAGTLTSNQLASLANALREAGNQHAGQLGKLCEAKLMDPSRASSGSLCTNGGAAEAEAALNRFLEQASGGGKEGNGAEALGACLSGNRPGRGGVSRGRGDAPLTWKDPSSTEGTRFKDTRLASAGMPDPETAKPIGYSASEPDNFPTGPSVQSGALAGATPAPQPGREAVILPRHRAAVERYFQSTPPPERTP